MRTASRIAALLVMVATAALLAGCGVISLAGSAAGAVIDVGAAVVSTTVRVTGKVAEKAIDAVGSTKDAPASPSAEAAAEEAAKKK